MEEISDEGHLSLHLKKKGGGKEWEVRIFLMLLIIISVIIHTLMFLVEKESKRKELTCFHTED